MSDEDEEYEYEEDADENDYYEYNMEDDENEDENFVGNVNDNTIEEKHSDAISGESKVSSGDSNRKFSSLSERKNGFGVIPDGSFRIIDYSEIETEMQRLVQEVSSLLDFSLDLCRLLLLYFKWDKERLIDNYYSDPEKVLFEAGLDKYVEYYDRKSLSENAHFRCRICCDDVSMSTMFSLGCDHFFCRPCYAEYLKQLISDGPSCVHAVCPEHLCKQSVPQSVITQLVSPEVSEKYRIYLTRNFIDKSKKMRWCPNAGCEKVAVGSGITNVLCSCGKPFCFKCGEEAHDPCSCDQLGHWLLKCSNESETANWILANTKKCPECNARIEKNQGCNHMSCKLCKHEFCWICMGSWKEHGQTTGHIIFRFPLSSI
jgi:ariadne-1